MEKFLEGGAESVTNEEIHAAIRKAAIEFKFVPVLGGSAFKNKGVQLMLDAIVNYLPSPLDVPPVEGLDVDDNEKKIQRTADDNEPFSALAFKIANDPYVGNLTCCRVYSGQVSSGTTLLNATRSKRERLSRSNNEQAQAKCSRQGYPIRHRRLPR